MPNFITQYLTIIKIGVIVFLIGTATYFYFDYKNAKEQNKQWEKDFNKTVEAYEYQLIIQKLETKEKAVVKEQKKVVIEKQKKVQEATKILKEQYEKIDEPDIYISTTF